MTLNLFMATRQVCLNNQAYYSLIWSTSARPCHGKTNSWSNYKIAVNKSQAVNMLTRKYKVWKFPHQGGGVYILFPPSPRILTDVRQDTTATMWRLSRRSCLRWCRREFFWWYFSLIDSINITSGSEHSGEIRSVPPVLSLMLNTNLNSIDLQGRHPRNKLSELGRSLPSTGWKITSVQSFYNIDF